MRSQYLLFFSTYSTKSYASPFWWMRVGYFYFPTMHFGHRPPCCLRQKQNVTFDYWPCVPLSLKTINNIEMRCWFGWIEWWWNDFLSVSIVGKFEKTWCTESFHKESNLIIYCKISWWTESFSKELIRSDM